MKKIVAIGGGELSLGETEPIDRYIVSLAGKETPDLLFIPTASHDAPAYIETVKQQYGRLGCRVHALTLFSCGLSQQKISNLILSSDIIYVGGGDTQTMMAKWNEFQVDTCLRAAYEKGIVLSGLSAGSICWCVAGYSDSEFFDATNKDPQYKWVGGLGLLPYLHCPHYDESGRNAFDALIQGQKYDGIALENQVALVSLDGKLSIIKANPAKNAYLFHQNNGVTEKTILA